MALTQSPAVVPEHASRLVERPRGRRVVELEGEHDVSTVGLLAATIARAIAQGDEDLVLDLRAIRFLDASSVTVFVRARAFLADRSRTLTLQRPPSCARRLIDVCGLAGLVQLSSPAGPGGP